VTQYNRNLPHWFPEGKSIFLTWRLYGSLPPKWAPKKIPGASLTDGQKFRQADSFLDRATSGPLWLKDPRISSNIVTTLKTGAEELKQYQLHAFVVMANHVHVLLLPQIPVARITKGIKGVTAKQANELLGRTGQYFWQDESYDHWVRDDAEFAKIKAYIERNPVTAGLVKAESDWPWSSAYVPPPKR
jgi:REP element-mobilizing transposase RayT